MISLILVLICGFLFILFNECEDESVRNNWPDHLAFLNQRGSWKRKWKIVDGQTHRFVPNYWRFTLTYLRFVQTNWRFTKVRKAFKFPLPGWYFWVYPEYQEKYLYSSTLFVFKTDPEHGFQFAKLRMIELALLIVNWKLFLAWEIGLRLFTFFKERWLKYIH